MMVEGEAYTKLGTGPGPTSSGSQAEPLAGCGNAWTERVQDLCTRAKEKLGKEEWIARQAALLAGVPVPPDAAEVMIQP